jgi:hypothetical protein
LKEDAHKYLDIFYDRLAKMPEIWNEMDEPSVPFFGVYLIETLEKSKLGGYLNFSMAFPTF